MIKFRSKLLLVVISLIALVMIILGAFFVQLFESHNYKNFEESMATQVEEIVIYIKENGGIEALQNNSDTLKGLQLLSLSVTLVAKDAGVIHTSSVPNHLNKEEHLAYVQTFLNQSEQGYGEIQGGNETYYFWQPITDSIGEVEGSVVVS